MSKVIPKTSSEIVGIYLAWLKQRGVKGLDKPLSFAQILSLAADEMLKEDAK